MSKKNTFYDSVSIQYSPDEKVSLVRVTVNEYPSDRKIGEFWVPGKSGSDVELVWVRARMLRDFNATFGEVKATLSERKAAVLARGKLLLENPHTRR